MAIISSPTDGCILKMHYRLTPIMFLAISYPYVEDNNGSREYILFYRGIVYVFVILALVFFLPNRISKHMEDKAMEM